ncbi:MAG: archaemetzincin [Verrucomicrobiales bacterium]
MKRTSSSLRRPAILVLWVALVATCVWRYVWAETRGPFSPPDAPARADAVGELGSLPAAMRRAFSPVDAAFAPLPEPGASDWLNGPGRGDRGGQTFADFLEARRNPVTGARRTLYLAPLGDFSDIGGGGGGEMVESLRAFASIYFGLPAKTLPDLDPATLAITERQNPSTRQRQWLTTDILAALKAKIPADAYCLIALTPVDLYPDPDWNFVFGQASLADRVGVFSLARYASDPGSGQTTVLQRACKVLTHEIGHMFGARHCIHFHCNMNGSNGLWETDRAPLHLCPACLRKIQTATQFKPAERYEELAKFYTKYGLDAEAEWAAGRRERVAD